jgi:DNA-binding response OmpR family regulator
VDKDVLPKESMEVTALTEPQSVLIVDRSEETREVLRTALERRGLKIYSASRPDMGLQLARQHRPDLIVLDLEVAGTGPVCAPFAEHSQTDRSILVMLGTMRRDAEGLPAGEIVPKPYHYGPLIRKIEGLLMGTGQGYARCA